MSVRSIVLVSLCSFVLWSDAVTITKLNTYESGIFDDSAAEIVAHDPITQRLFVTNAADSAIDILDFSDPASSLPKISSISIPNGGPNSVAVSPDGSLVAVATEAVNKQDPGTVQFYDGFGNGLGSTMVGALPDMLTFTPDGNTLLVANEGEPNDAYDNDPEGSISIIDVSSGLVASFTVQTADFNSFDAGTPPANVRIFGPNASFSQDVEPEYIVVSKDSATAYVVLQENNAIAVVDIATATVTDVIGLGCKDHSPDALAAFEVDGTLYIATANEGDARDYDGFSEEDRVKDLILDPTGFPDAATLQLDENLGRLTITLAQGDSDGDGDVDIIHSYGARSFSIWKASDVSLVYDSGSEFEDKTAELLPALFNANNDEDEADARSDDKGPEPEAIATGMLQGVLHAFIGLERIGGVMVYDISDPTSPSFVDYVNNRQIGPAGDLGPECIIYIHSDDSPTGEALMVVANEVSGTTTAYSFGVASEATDEPTPSPTEDEDEKGDNFWIGIAGVALLNFLAFLAILNVVIGIFF